MAPFDQNLAPMPADISSPPDPKTRPDSPPPPYTEQPTNHWDSNPERLRRFLSYCLAVDYGLETVMPDRLRRDDWSHFMSTSSACYAYWREQRCKSPTMFSTSYLDWPAELSSVRLNRALFTDADKLNLPRPVVVRMLCMFTVCTKVLGRHNQSWIQHISKYHSMQRLATKPSTDRDLVFDIIYPGADDDTTHQQMIGRNESISSIYFDRLAGGSGCQLTEAGLEQEHEVQSGRAWFSEPSFLRFHYAMGPIPPSTDILHSAQLSTRGSDGSP